MCKRPRITDYTDLHDATAVDSASAHPPKRHHMQCARLRRFEEAVCSDGCLLQALIGLGYGTTRPGAMCIAELQEDTVFQDYVAQCALQPLPGQLHGHTRGAVKDALQEVMAVASRVPPPVSALTHMDGTWDSRARRPEPIPNLCDQRTMSYPRGSGCCPRTCGH